MVADVPSWGNCHRSKAQPETSGLEMHPVLRGALITALARLPAVALARQARAATVVRTVVLCLAVVAVARVAPTIVVARLLLVVARLRLTVVATTPALVRLLDTLTSVTLLLSPPRARARVRLPTIHAANPDPPLPLPEDRHHPALVALNIKRLFFLTKKDGSFSFLYSRA